MIKFLKEIVRQIKYNESPYVPGTLYTPSNLLDVVSAWKGNEKVIKDIIDFTGIKTKSCLEFGVDNAYSTVAFSNFFDTVTGVDIFTGDFHAGLHEDNFISVSQAVSNIPNIKLVKADYKDFIKNNTEFYDLIHVDIVHSYEDTYRCGLWAAEHSDCTLFHDTISFMEVIKAVKDISKKTNKRFYHFRELYGLGILCNK